MKMVRKLLALLVTISLILQLSPVSVAADASPDYSQNPPKNLDVSKTNGNYDISYDSSSNENTVKLEWTAPDPVPADVESEDIGNNGDIVERGYRIYTSEDNTSENLYPASIGTATSFEINKNGDDPLKPGTIYYARAKAYHKHRDDKGMEVDHESSASNTAIFMTDIDVEVKAVGTDALEIKWNDVLFNGKRIDYDIYISESKDFVGATSLSVREENISNYGPIIPIPAEKKLSFTASGQNFGIRAGTIYYIKIKPIVRDSRVRYNPETKVVVGYTQIIAGMTRISGDWWRIDWNPVTNASLGAGEKITYKVKRGDMAQWDNPVLITIGETTDTKYNINTKGGNYFYIIVAEVKDQFGNPIPDGIQSHRLKITDADVPVKPPVPELKEIITKPVDDPSGEVIYSYTASLQPNEATIAWTPPKLANGNIDQDMLYDIWVLTDPADINNPNAVKKTVKTFDQLKIADEVVAYTYKITGLTPNTTYYFKIVAKRLYTINQDGLLITKYYESDPAIKVIVTPTGGPIDQPVAPAKPPFRIMLKDNGTFDITQTTACVTWDNTWWEEWDSTAQKWKNVTEEEYNQGRTDPLRQFRQVGYDQGVSFRIGYTVYQEGMDYNTIANLPTQITGISNDTAKVEQQYNIQGLQPNTTYVVWLRAYRQSVDMLSEASDPVIVVTRPDIEEPVERPTVPKFYFNRAGDTYVDLQWAFNPGYSYNLKYSTSDNLQSASGTKTVTPEELLLNPVYRIDGLDQDTQYYFWIQADSTGNNDPLGLSIWSDSYAVRTLPYQPPETPTGFGIKGTADAIGKNSIAFEWNKVGELEYILEYASDIAFTSPKEVSAKSVSEYTIDGLRSNFRYYVRLYAYDPVKKLRSKPTNAIIVRTLRSDDEYDSDVDIEDIIKGPFVEETVSGGTWVVKVTGVNADRLIEKVLTDDKLDYMFDMSKPAATVNKRVVLLSNKIFRALSDVKENIMIDAGACVYTLKPQTFDTDQVLKLAGKNAGNVDIEITITEPGKSGYTAEDGLVYRSSAMELSINAIAGTSVSPVKQIGKPLREAFKFTDLSLFTGGRTGGYAYDSNSGKWVKQEATVKYDDITGNGYVYMDLAAPGRTSLIERTKPFIGYYDIYSDPAKEAIAAIASVYDLKSAKGPGFRPFSFITAEEAVKLMMDVLGVNYGIDYAEMGVKAGFISTSDLNNMGRFCSRDEVFNMIDRVYEIKTRSTAPARSRTDGGSQPVTRSDVMLELYRVLHGIGEV